MICRRNCSDVEVELTGELATLKADWDAKALNVTPVDVTLKRTQIRVTDLRLVWVPVG